MATPTNVDIWESMTFECPNCCEENVVPNWLKRGDKVKCKICGHISKVKEHLANCRQEKVPNHVLGH